MKFNPQITAVAVAALVASAAAVSAQQAPERERGGAGNPPAASERAPTGPATDGQGQKEHRAPGAAKGEATEPSKGRAAQNPSQERNDRSRHSEGNKSKGDSNAKTTRDQNSKPTDTKRRNATDTGRKDRKTGDQAEGVSKDRNPTRASKNDKNGAAKERQANRGEHESSQKFRALSDEQRTKVRQSFDRKAHVTKVNFNIRIGTRVPRTVHLYPVPTAVIAVLPEYRSYRYVVVEDTICIIDPTSYEIVDVIDETPTVRHEQIATLRLSDRDRGYVVSEIRPDDFPHVGVNVRLALGAEIPDGVRLERFPVAVEDRIPQLRDFRFVQVDRDVVIVQPDQRTVVDVISR